MVAEAKSKAGKAIKALLTYDKAGIGSAIETCEWKSGTFMFGEFLNEGDPEDGKDVCSIFSYDRRSGKAELITKE